VRWGLAYGVVVYFFMRYVVIPISAAPSLPFSLAGLARGLAIHLVCVGLPIALVARLLAPPPASMR
jgi:hypothetical protein